MFVHLSAHKIFLPHMIWRFYVSKVIRLVSKPVALSFRAAIDFYYSVIALYYRATIELYYSAIELPQTLLYGYRDILQNCHRVIFQSYLIEFIIDFYYRYRTVLQSYSIVLRCNIIELSQLYSYIIELPQLYCSVIL